MANIYRAKLDIKTVRPDFKPTFVQYDHARLEIKLTDGGQPYDLSTASRVEFTHVRGDNAVIIQPGEIVSNNGDYIVTYDYQGSEMGVRGVVKTSFAIFNTDGKKVSSPIFDVTIVKDLRDDVFSPAEPNAGLLQKLISDVEYAKENSGFGEMGPPGERGEDGYTPVKGVDYTDGKDGRDGEDGYTPIKGVDYADGINGKDGKDGYTPIKGVDYFDGVNGRDGEKGEPFTYADFTQSQIEALRGPRGLQGERGADGYTPIKGTDYFDGVDGKDGRDGQRGNVVINANTTKKAYLTITDDDIESAVWTKLKPLSEELNVPITLAAISSWVNQSHALSSTQLLYLQNELGWEIANHTHTHPQLNVLTNSEVEFEVLESNKILKNLGLDVKNFIAPYGSNVAEHVRKIASNYFNCGVSVEPGINTFPVDNQLLKRVPLGSYFNGEGQNTFEYYKSQVDEAIRTDGWIIFMTHCASVEHNALQQQHLRDVIIYAQSQGVEIVNLQDGFEKFGNVIEVEGVMSISRKGEIFTRQSNFGATVYATKDDITYATKPNEIYAKFKDRLVVNFYYYADNQVFPSREAGVLITYSFGSYAGLIQEWRPYQVNSVYQRYTADDDGETWSAWGLVGGSSNTPIHYEILSRNRFTSSAPITEYPNNRVSLFYVNFSGATGFPNDTAGTVITYKNGESGIYFQEFKEFESHNKWTRYWSEYERWSAWDKITTQLTPVIYTTTNRPTTNTVPGQTYFDMTLNKPVWRNASNDGWVDASGTSV